MEKLEEKIFDLIKSDYSFKEISEKEMLENLKDVSINNIKPLKILNDLLKLGTNISNYYLSKNIFNFLKEIEEISWEKRAKFLSGNFDKENFGGKILFIISKLDSLNKPKIIANLFKAMVYEQISKEDFFSLSAMVDKLYYGDLIKLKNQTEFLEKSSNTFILMGLGILNMDTDKTFQMNLMFELSERGEKLIKYGLKI